MAGGVEFAGSVLDTLSFFLVTPDIIGKERITRAGAYIGRIRDSILAAGGRLMKYMEKMGTKLWYNAYVAIAAAAFLAWLALENFVQPSSPSILAHVILPALWFASLP